MSFEGVRGTFTSRMLLDRPRAPIDAACLDDPFEPLDTRWTFTDVEGGACDVAFLVDDRFESLTLGALRGTMVDRAFHEVSEAFPERADEVHGAR